MYIVIINGVVLNDVSSQELPVYKALYPKCVVLRKREK